MNRFLLAKQAEDRAPSGCGPQARWLCCSLLTYRTGYASSLAPRQRAWGPAAECELISARTLCVLVVAFPFGLTGPEAHRQNGRLVKGATRLKNLTSIALAWIALAGPLAAQTEYHFDFGPPDSPVAAGFTGVMRA